VTALIIPQALMQALSHEGLASKVMQPLKLPLIRYHYVPEGVMATPLPPGELLDRGTLSAVNALPHLDARVLPLIQPSLRSLIVAGELPGAFG